MICLPPSPPGILFGVLAAVGQATGLVFSKQGMQGDFPPIQANAIRMLAAVIALLAVMFLQRQAGKTVQTLRDNPRAVPLLAVQNTEVGIASVLTSLSPIFMLPIAHFLFKEHLGWQAIAGTLLAMAGVSILFLT